MTRRFLPHVTVACVIHYQSQFLLVEERIDGQRVFNQPAGHLEPNETLLSACQREIQEETGLDLTPDGFVNVYQFIAADQTPFIRFTFACQTTGIHPTQPQDPQIDACHWLSLAQIQTRQLPLRGPLVLQSIHDVIRGQISPIEQALHNRLIRA
ncbi:NUDIX hydrolase [Ferrimonas pelagia]|uniref:Phosphatase NudJ n=1 Tax=Ferrimonas pelagia TaxID=1177826 RepID=A0ABP9FJ68_9GAMM